MTDTVNAVLTGLVQNPATTIQPDGADPNFNLGRQADLIVSELHGKFYTANYRAALFTANVTAVTVPVVASGLVSVYTLYNPVGSGINMCLVDCDITSVLATLVVNTFGLYFSAGTVAAAGTFTTEGTARSGKLSSAVAGNVGKFYSAYTHSGTPVRWRILGGHHATTSIAVGGIHVDFDGKAIIRPGTAVSVASSTAAGTTSGLDIGMTWMEFPE